MAVLSAIFEATDRMSDVLGSMADSGSQAIAQFEQAGEAANAAFEQTSQAANSVARAMETSSQSTDYWTSAIGNYDKSAMEAVYSTEELVEMGYKSADALNEQSEMLALCEKSASELSQSMSATIGIEESLNNAMKEAAEISEQVANADGVSAETKEELSRASETAAAAMEELHKAQEEATAAMEAYDATMMSGTNDLAELEAAAERAGHAAENLAEANGNATNATEELSNASDKASEELENAGNKGAKAFDELASALAAVGITAMLKEMAEAAYELADAFSEAEKTVVLATGATGEALSGLDDSMMNAYASAKAADLSSTAGAIGEINTRLGLTGNELENVTGLFLDYANITNQDVVSSVGNVTKLMNQWGVELSNVEGLMDKLSYAGQMSGINVGTLTNSLVTNRAILEQVGFSLDESIGLLAQAELQGINVQTVMMGLRTAITNFSADGLDASTALREVVNDIATLGDESEATALAIDTFGSRAGAILAGSIRGGQLSIDNLSASLENASGTLKSTAEASQTLGEKWQQSSNKVKTAFTSAIEPAINKYSTALASATGKMGDFLNAHPKLTAGLTAVGVGLGAVTLGIVGVTTVVNVAIPAFISLGTAVNAALGPIGWITIGVVGVTAALATLIPGMNDTNNAMVKLTASSEKQAEEIANLQTEYEKMCSAGEESSSEAIYLKYQIDTLTDSFENSKQTLEEYIATCEEANTAWNETLNTNRDAYEAVETSEGCYLALTQRLSELASQSDITVASQEEMKAIIDKLNESVPGLSLNYDKVVDSAGDFADVVENMIKAQANMQRYEKAQQGMIDSYEIIYEAGAQLDKLRQEEALELEKNTNLQEKYNKAYESYINWIQQGGRGNNPYEKNKNDLKKALDESESALESYQTQISETQKTLDDAQGDYDKYLETITEIAGVTEDAFKNLTDSESIIDAMATSVESLGTAYNNAYTEAQKSFEGQFGLFDVAKADAEATVSNMQNALNSQLSFWETYAANLDVLKTQSANDLGVSETQYQKLIDLASEGTEEAAGLAQSMADAIKSGNEESIVKIVDTLGKIEDAKAKAASSAAEWKIDFDGKMDEIVKKAESTINDMNLSPEATQAATDTMNAYANAIRSQGATAIANAKSIAAQIKSALESASANINIGVSGGTGGVQKNARGTTNAADIFIAGEEGPELVVGYGGATVYDAAETERMLSADRPTPLHVNAPESVEGQKTQNITKSEKRVVIALEGGGEIKVPQGVDKETVMQILTSNLRPALLNIIQEEIFEEGEGSYAY